MADKSSYRTRSGSRMRPRPVPAHQARAAPSAKLRAARNRTKVRGYRAHTRAPAHEAKARSARAWTGSPPKVPLAIRALAGVACRGGHGVSAAHGGSPSQVAANRPGYEQMRAVRDSRPKRGLGDALRLARSCPDPAGRQPAPRRRDTRRSGRLDRRPAAGAPHRGGLGSKLRSVLVEPPAADGPSVGSRGINDNMLSARLRGVWPQRKSAGGCRTYSSVASRDESERLRPRSRGTEPSCNRPAALRRGFRCRRLRSAEGSYLSQGRGG